MLIVCSKQDLPLAKAASAIRVQLEKELDILRVTSQARLDDGHSQSAVRIGRKDRAFSFDDLSMDVQFCEACLHQGKEDMEQIYRWLFNAV